MSRCTTDPQVDDCKNQDDSKNIMSNILLIMTMKGSEKVIMNDNCDDKDGSKDSCDDNHNTEEDKDDCVDDQ